MDFSNGLPSQAFTRITYSMLRELLRLPKHVEIAGLRPDPSNDRGCVIDLSGLIPPGELTIDYAYQHTTIVTCKGFRQK